MIIIEIRTLFNELISSSSVQLILTPNFGGSIHCNEVTAPVESPSEEWPDLHVLVSSQIKKQPQQRQTLPTPTNISISKSPVQTKQQTSTSHHKNGSVNS